MNLVDAAHQGELLGARGYGLAVQTQAAGSASSLEAAIQAHDGDAAAERKNLVLDGGHDLHQLLGVHLGPYGEFVPAPDPLVATP